MKKLVNASLMIAVLLFLSGNMFAQISFNKGIKAGYHSANVSLDPDSDTGSRSAIAFGGFLELDLLGPIDIQGEVLYSPKGAKDKSGSETTVKVNYLEIPVLVKFQMPLAPTVSWNSFIGPYFGFKINESTDPDMGNNEDLFKSSDLGGVIGLGLKFNALISFVTVDARYSLGFSDIADGGETKIKNRVFAIYLGLGF
jgi:hypothetical protein